MILSIAKCNRALSIKCKITDTDNCIASITTEYRIVLK